MKVILFGATGMVGQGALRECLKDPDVERVLSVGRSSMGQEHPKLTELVRKDLSNFAEVEDTLRGYDACFFCLGISSAGMSEADYRRITLDITVAAAETLSRLNPGMTFVFVSGAGTDSTEKGSVMWARVKGAAENAVLRQPFKASYMFRPGFIRPLHGITSRTRAYRVAYVVMWPFLPLLRLVLGQSMLTTESIGRAMLIAAKRGAPKPVLEARDIGALAASQPS
jgi:uncharacterized protein YbjT (DUF2867 family)